MPDETTLIQCECGARLEAAEGGTSEYYGEHPACWALFGEVLAREYSDYRFAAVHRLTVDAYAAQHPGKPERRTIKSVAVHLIGLHLALERGVSSIDAVQTLQSAADRSAEYHWLVPPSSFGDLTVVYVHGAGGDPELHKQRVQEWAGHTWRAWAAHHAQVRAWAAALKPRSKR